MTETRVETVARAIYEADPDRTEGGQLIPWETWFEWTRDRYRNMAAAAIAALPPSPAEEAVKRVAEELKDRQAKAVVAGSYFPELSRERSRWGGRATGYGIAGDLIRAALASPAPAPPDGVR